MIELVYGFNRHDADTDGDGVTDYTEFCITCTDVLVPDGEIDTDGDGLTNAEEAVYGTNPDDLDTDNDNLGDYEEIMVLHTDPLVKNATQQGTDSQFPDSLESGQITQPGNQPNAFDGPVIDDGGLGGNTTYNTILTTAYGTSNVSYQLIDNWFINNSNSAYNKQLAITSSLLSAIAYRDSYLGNTSTTASNSQNAVRDWFTLHGFTDYSRYDLNLYEFDQHVSEMFVAHKEVTNGATTKVLVCVVIRGTNGTIQEWQSNFDVGTTDDYGSTTGWTSSTNHMGFDITANRLDAWLTNYLIDNGILTANKAFWITGHSRGGALANLLAAKRVDAGYEVFGYTFASPNTTTKGGANSDAKYQCIFNVINTDDLVPQLPMEAWGFKRFGVDVAGSIEEDYADDWDALMHGEFTYTSGITAVANTVEAFEDIADNRNQCYEYRSGITAYYVDLLYSSSDAAALAAMDVMAGYPENTAGTYTWVPTSSTELYGYAMYQQPAFFMQLLAAYMGERINKTEFVTTRVAGYLGTAKERLIICAGLNLQMASKIDHPHYTESYYLLAAEING